MQLLAFGLNHTTAPIRLREKIAFAPAQMPDALRDLKRDGNVREAAILSTCNRTEIYCRQESPQPSPEHVLNWLSAFGGFDARDLAASSYAHADASAVRHAFRVASGLDSMIVGEPQILGQMKRAFSIAHDAAATGKVLNRLFQHSFSVAKRVRSDTRIGANAVSVASAGVELATRIFDSLAEQNVLLIGAGETMELVARHLRRRQVRRMVIANRSLSRARLLADAAASPDTTCEAVTLARLPEHLHRADIVVTSTASTLPLLGKGAIEAALKKRKHKPMFMLDLAVPRDIEPEAAQLDGVYLYTLDDLADIAADNRALRQDEADDAESIIDLQVVRFMRWMRALDATPSIVQLRAQLEGLRDEELNKALKQIAQGADAEAVIKNLAHGITQKFAHAPSETLRRAGVDGDASALAALRRLFKL